jgi:hypothetical protein
MVGGIFGHVDEPVVFVLCDVPAYFYGSGRWVVESSSFRRLAVANEDAENTFLGPLLPQSIRDVDIGDGSKSSQVRYVRWVVVSSLIRRDGGRLAEYSVERVYLGFGCFPPMVDW